MMRKTFAMAIMSVLFFSTFIGFALMPAATPAAAPAATTTVVENKDVVQVDTVEAAAEEMAETDTAGYKTIISPGWDGDGVSIQDWYDGLTAAGFTVVNLAPGQIAAGITTEKGANAAAVCYSTKYTNNWYTSAYATQKQTELGLYTDLAVSDTSQAGPICPSALPSSGYYATLAADLNSGDHQATDPATGEKVVQGQGIFQVAGMVYEQICRTAGGAPGSAAWIAFFGNDGKFNYVTHSMGGLVCRTLIQYYGLGPYMQTIVNVQAPHWGVPLGNWVEGLAQSMGCIPIIEKSIYTIGTGLIGPKSATAWDMRAIWYGGDADHPFLDNLDTDQDGIPEVSDCPATAPGGWYTIAGHPGPANVFSLMPGFEANNWVVEGLDLTGFDALVPQDGAWLGGSTMMITTDNHATARNNAQTINKIAACLGIPASVPGATDVLAGALRIAIRGFASNKDMDTVWPGSGDPFFKIWVAEEGGSWTFLGEVWPGVDLSDTNGYFKGDSTDQASGTLVLCGTKKWVSVMVEVWDDDGIWPESPDYWDTFTMHGIAWSEDIDGVDSYYSRVQSGGSWSKLWISARGFTADVSKCVKANVWLSQVYYEDDSDPWPKGAGEMFMCLWAGPAGLEQYQQTGQKSRDGSGTLTWSVTMFNSYMLKDATLSIRSEAWEADDWPDTNDHLGTLAWSAPAANYVGAGTCGWGPYDSGVARHYLYFTVTAC